jgi:hypothetical protein
MVPQGLRQELQTCSANSLGRITLAGTLSHPQFLILGEMNLLRHLSQVMEHEEHQGEDLLEP